MKEFDEFDDFDEGRGQSIDIMPYVHKALKKWKLILLWAFVGGVFGVVIALSTPKTYTTSAVVAPEITTRANSGGLSSLASLAGINMNSMAITDAMHPTLYPVVINSTSFYVSLFDLPVTVATKDSLVHTDLYDYIVTYNKRPWWGSIFAAPHMALQAIKGLFANPDEFEDAIGHDHIDSLRLTRQQEMVVKSLARNISAAVDKKTYVLSLKVTMQDRIISAQVANAVIDKLDGFVTSYRTEKARETADYYELLYKETREDYLRAQHAYTYYLDTHQGLASKRDMVQQTHLQNESQLRYQMYSKTAQNLMDARARVQLESPVLVVLQPGIAPNKGKPSRVKLVLLWSFLGALACFGWICWKK